MLYSGYPVEAGAADSLAKPGRNVTGNAIYAGTGVWGKMLQLLREAKPDIERVGILWTYVIPAFPMRYAPLSGRDGGGYKSDLGRERTEIFLRPKSLNSPSGKSAEQAGPRKLRAIGYIETDHHNGSPHERSEMRGPHEIRGLCRCFVPRSPAAIRPRLLPLGSVGRWHRLGWGRRRMVCEIQVGSHRGQLVR
jgi:hypothetical protein